MNKKIYIAPEMEVVMADPMQILDGSIPMNDDIPAKNESGMESKAVGFIVDDDEDM